MVGRDTKAALLLFIGGGNFTEAVDKAVATVNGHARCQRQLQADDPYRTQ